MGIVAIAALVIAIIFVVLAFFLIPVLLEIKKTAATVRTYITDVDSELKPILREMRELTMDLRALADSIASRSDDVRTFMTAVGETGRNVSRINAVIGDVADVFCRSSLWMTGLKAAGRYVIHRIAKKGR
ncbi:MAG TPA: DUF948 domain-containing protein [Geobacteraceae bacterium]|nr:DUF948 domain-containing protein [Geobacteraceae bacterium]